MTFKKSHAASYSWGYNKFINLCFCDPAYLKQVYNS